MRPNRLILASVVALGAAAVLPAVTAHAAANLVSNPSVEAAGAGGQPADWTFNRWGTNTATSAWRTGGHDGQRSLAVTVSGYASGDAKWVSAPMTVRPGVRYTVSDWYVATVATSLEAVYTDATGKQTYAWLADAPASAAWKQVSAAFTAPAGTVKVSIYHVLERNGTLQTDAYVLTEAGGTTPPPPPTVTVTAPATGATVSGTEQITATAGTDVVGVRFQVDGVDVGAEDTAAPYAATWDTTRSANGARTVSAVARTADNRTAATNVTVTVDNAAAPAPPPAPQPGNLIANPSVDSGSGGTPAGWSSVRWGTNTATFGWLTTGRTGGRSVRTEITAYTNGDARWHHTAAAVTAGRTYQYTGWYQSNVATEIDVEVTMTNGTKQYVYLATAPASTAWAKATAQWTAPAGAAKVIVYQVLSRKGWLVGDDVALTEYAPTQLRRAMVSLTFDDGWLNQLTNARPLLDRYGFKATFYVLSGVSDWDGYMTREQMGTLATAGHEIASHTISHPHLTTLPSSTMDGELRTSQSTLRQWYGPGVAKNFASPYGEYNAAVQAASRTYYRSHRSTDEGFNTEDDTDVDNLKVQNILDTTTPAQVGAWVDQAVRDRSWLILVYHEVGTGLEDPTYAVTPANLDAELRLIQSKGVAVRTVDQALDEIVPQLG